MSKNLTHINERHTEALGGLVARIVAEGIPAEARDIYKGRNRVTKLELEGSRPVNIKQFRVPNVFNRWAYAHIRTGKARRAYSNALRLIELGFTTPEPLAWIELREGSPEKLGLSYFISEQLEGWQEIRIAEEQRHTRLIDIAEAVGHLLYSLHKAGVWMKDASPGNILWRRGEGGSIRLALVDINRMSFNVHSRKTLMQNFGRLFAGETATLAAARAYARAGRGDAEEVEGQALRARARARKKQSRKQALKKLFRL